MKVLIVADIHGNSTALRAVLNDAGDVDALWCAGDIVGYGPDPVECIEMVRGIPNVCIAGNHDVGVAGNVSGFGSAGMAGNDGAVGGRGVGVIGYINPGSFNPEAKIARDWTRSMLDEEQISFLAQLPLMAEPLTCVLMVHGAPVVGMPVFRVYDQDRNPGERSEMQGIGGQDGLQPEQDYAGQPSGMSGAQSIGMPVPGEHASGKLTSDSSPSSETGFSEPTQADRHSHKNAPSQDKKPDSEKGTNGSLGVWEYVTSSWQAEEIFSMSQHGFSQKLFIVGHTHVPLAFVKGDGAGVEYVPLETGDIIELDFASFKYLLNPGSVGQPRDGDPRASYMLYDTEANVIEYHCVEYDVAEVIDRVDSVGLPHNLGARLEIGL
jgi:predicted phosphodiesterase